MFDNISYKTRNYLLLLATILFAYVAYNQAIKKTIAAKQDYDALQENVSLSELSLAQKKELETESNQLNAIIGTKENFYNVQQSILEEVSVYCNKHNLILTQFPETQSYQEKEYLIETNQFEIKGTFKQLLDLQYKLENEYKGARIASIKYYSKKDLETKKVDLYLNVQLQNIKKTEI